MDPSLDDGSVRVRAVENLNAPKRKRKIIIMKKKQAEWFQLD
jgi:hypothetical protein